MYVCVYVCLYQYLYWCIETYQSNAVDGCEIEYFGVVVQIIAPSLLKKIINKNYRLYVCINCIVCVYECMYVRTVCFMCIIVMNFCDVCYCEPSHLVSRFKIAKL